MFVTLIVCRLNERQVFKILVKVSIGTSRPFIPDDNNYKELLGARLVLMSKRTMIKSLSGLIHLTVGFTT